MTIRSAEFSEGRALEADVVIVGAGAAGITLACELDGYGVKVLLLESGGIQPDPSLDDYYLGSASAPHPDPSHFRRAAFGGTTGLGGGRCVPFDPIDFEYRDYADQSGWPIPYSEVARYYPQALTYCDAGEFNFTTQSVARPKPLISGFDGRGVVIDDRIERYSLPTDFGKRYRRRIERSANVTALLNARCLRLIRRTGDDAIEAAEFVDRAGHKSLVRAGIFVLATGGIEVPRLLMASDSAGTGLGNRYDLLGRFYSCHFEGVVGKVVPARAAVDFSFAKTSDGVYYRRQLRFSEATLRAQRLLNIVFRLHFPSYSDASHGSSVMSTIYLAKSVLVPEYRAIFQHNVQDVVPSRDWDHVLNIVKGIPQLSRFAFDYLFRIRLAQRKLPYTLIANADGSYPLEFNCEQTPLASNRITLSNVQDRHGMPRVRIDWRICDADIASAARSLRLLQTTMSESGACTLEFDDATLEAQLGRSVPLGGHHIGTARMAATPRTGVTDGNGSVFDLPNLYIASSAVFPTSSHANPTLTIVALAVRLGKHLRERVLSRRSASLHTG